MSRPLEKKDLHAISMFLAIIEKFETVSSMDSLAQTIVDVCENVVKHDSMGCYLIDPDDPVAEVKLRAQKGLSPIEIKLASDSAMQRHPGIVMRNKKSLLIRDTKRDDQEVISSSSPRHMTVRSRAWVPIVVSGRSVGSFGLASQQIDNFDEVDLGMLEFVAFIAHVTYDVLARTSYFQKEREKVRSEIKDRSAFFAFINHEIRNPINAILGYSEILVEQELSQQQSKYIRNINKAAVSLLRLTTDLSDLSKLSANKMELVEGELFLKELIEEVAEQYSLEANQKNIAFTYFISEDANCCFIGDQDRLKQVISNLVSNAVKFTQEGEIAVVASATHDFHTKSKIHIDVFDTGIGIKEEDLPKLFKEYSQVENCKNNPNTGLGLGLNLSQKLVRLMGGTISARSDYEIGTNFSFNIFLKKKNNLSATKFYSQINNGFIISSTKFLAKNLALELKKYGIRSEKVYGLDFANNLQFRNQKNTIIFVDHQALETTLDASLSKLHEIQVHFPSAFFVLLKSSSETEICHLVDTCFDASLSKSFRPDQIENLLDDLEKSSGSKTRNVLPFDLVGAERKERSKFVSESLKSLDLVNKSQTDIYGKQLHIFKEKAPRFMNQLQTSYQQLSERNCAKYAQALAGESAAIEAEFIVQKCNRIEFLSKREQWDIVGQLIFLLADEVRALCLEIETLTFISSAPNPSNAAS